MNKLKELKALVQASDSYMWASRALILLLAFKALDYVYGMAIALAVAICVAALAPVFIRRIEQDRYREDRKHAFYCLKNLYEQANRERSWSVRGMPDDEAKTIRFAAAQRKANQVYRALELRAKHLDRCQSEGIVPHPGADWIVVAQVASKITDMLDSAQWLCTNGLAPETGLLDPNWVLDVSIQDQSSLEDEAEIEAKEKRERVVVDMDEYSALRKHKVRPYGEAELLQFDEDQRSNDNR